MVSSARIRACFCFLYGDSTNTVKELESPWNQVQRQRQANKSPKYSTAIPMRQKIIHEIKRLIQVNYRIGFARLF